MGALEVSDLGWGQELAGGAPGRAEDDGGGGAGRGILWIHELFFFLIEAPRLYSWVSFRALAQSNAGGGLCN